jgi:hypothetical protein
VKIQTQRAKACHQETHPSSCCDLSRATRILLGLVLLLTILTSPVRGDSSSTSSTGLLTGDAFQRQLDAVVGVGWSDLSLRHMAGRLTDRWQLAVFLDRRVDPDQMVRFEAARQSLRETLQQLADSLDLEVQFWDGLIYIGPPGVAGRVLTAAELKGEEIRRWGGEEGRAARAREPLRWERLAEPRGLVKSLALSASWSVENLEAIPHDLWWENQLPPLPWSHRMTLLLAGFELTFERSSDPNSLRIVPLPTELELERRYPLGGRDAAVIRQLQDMFPEAEFRRVGNQVHVRGSATAHAETGRMLRGEVSGGTAGIGRTERPGRAGETGRAGDQRALDELRFTLRATNRVEAILQAIVQQTELQLDLPADATELLQARVTIEVEDARLEELLDHLIRRQGWTYELQERELKIRGPEPSP